jgi:hypothetical protein
MAAPPASPQVELGGIYSGYFTGSGAWSLTGLRSLRFAPGLSPAVFGADGLVEPLIATIMACAPIATLETLDLATVLAKLGVSQYAIPQTTVITGLDLYRQRVASLGQRSSSSVHTKYNTVRGLLVPRSISARQAGEAALALELFVLWDGSANLPLIVTPSSALAGVPGLAAVYTLGPIKINGTLMWGVQDLNLDFGLGVQVDGPCDGELYPRDAHVGRQAPSGGFTTVTAEALTTLGLTGTSITADVVIFLRKKLQGAGNVPDATAEHIAITFQAGLALVDSHALGDPTGVTTGVRFVPTKKTGQSIITLSTTSAIG